jgi:hypothetical protein
MTPTLVAARAADAAVRERARIKKHTNSFLMVFHSSFNEEIIPFPGESRERAP